MPGRNDAGYVVRVRRVAAPCIVAFAALLMVVGGASPALAHGGGGADASNFDSTVTGVTAVSADAPLTVAGVEWEVLANDALLRVTVSGHRTVTVLGYEDEPYLRIGPDGVFENHNSPAAYLNQDRYALTPVPSGVGPEVTPRWRKVTDASAFAWHDHRIHWMAATLPPQAKANPGVATVIQEWTVPFMLDGEALMVRGRLRWVPPPVWWPWALGAMMAALVPVAATAAMVGAAGRREAVLRAGAVVLAVVAIADAVYAIDDRIAVPATVGENVWAGLTSAVFVGFGVIGVVGGWRGGAGADLAFGVGAVCVAAGVGLTHLPALVSSQVATELPVWFTRAVVAGNLVMGVLAVAVLWLTGQFRVWRELLTVPDAPSEAPS